MTAAIVLLAVLAGGLALAAYGGKLEGQHADARQLAHAAAALAALTVLATLGHLGVLG